MQAESSSITIAYSNEPYSSTNCFLCCCPKSYKNAEDIELTRTKRALLDLFLENHALAKELREEAARKNITSARIIELINQGAEVNARDNYGCTALHFAAKLNRSDLVRTLLEQGALINALGKNNYTPLHLSAYLGHIENVRLFLQYEANTTIRSKTGDGFHRRPYDSAVQNGHQQIADMLKSHTPLAS